MGTISRSQIAKIRVKKPKKKPILLGQTVTVATLAKHLGVSPDATRALARRAPGFPKPIAGAGPQQFQTSEVLQYISECQPLFIDTSAPETSLPTFVAPEDPEDIQFKLNQVAHSRAAKEAVRKSGAIPLDGTGGKLFLTSDVLAAIAPIPTTDEK